MKLRNNSNDGCKGKRISELEEKIQLQGTEYLAYQEGEENGKLSLNSLKDYLIELVKEYLINNGIIRDDYVQSEPAFKLLATLPELIADRACKDEFGNNINDTYLTRDAVKAYVQSIYEDLFTENPPHIMDGYITVDMLSEAVLQLLNSGGAITNFPDEEDLTVKDGKLKFNDKEYDPNKYSGLGRVMLRRNMVDGVNVLTQEMMSKPNTRYIIQYDFDLRGETINVPDNCILHFVGGSLNNGKIVGEDTKVLNYFSGDAITSGNITYQGSVADEEDITQTNAEDPSSPSVLKFKDKTYNPDDYSGLGRVYLRKNIVTVEDYESGLKVETNLLTQGMLGRANTIYIIQYDYNLNGQTVTVPEGCVLKFEGGSLNNGTLRGNLTTIPFHSINIFTSTISLDGTWKIDALNPEWVKDSDDRTKIQWCLNQVDLIGVNHVKLASRTYLISGTRGLSMNSSTRLSGGSVPANFNSNSGGGNKNGTKLTTDMEEGDLLFVYFSKNQYPGGGCVIEGIEFRGNGKKCSGIHFRANNQPDRNIVVRECSFVDCQCGIKTSYGIDELVGAAVEFDSLMINWCKYGIYSDCLNNWVGLHIHDCTIEGNDEANIYLYNSGKAVCTSNVIIENNLLETAPKGIYLRTQKCNVRIEGNYFENGSTPQVNSIMGDGYGIIKILNNYEYVGAPSKWNLSYGKFIIEDTCKADYRLGLNAELISCNASISINTEAINIYHMGQTLESVDKEYSMCPLPDNQAIIMAAFGCKFPMWLKETDYLKRVSQEGITDDILMMTIPIYNPTEENVNFNPNYQLLLSGSVVQSWGVAFDVTPGFHLVNVPIKVTEDFKDINNYVRLFGGDNTLYIGVPVISNMGNIDSIKGTFIPLPYLTQNYPTTISLKEGYSLDISYKSTGLTYSVFGDKVRNTDGTLVSKVTII